MSQSNYRDPLTDSEVRRYIVQGCSHCDGWHRGEPCPTRMCDHYIEVPGDPWAGTYCKLLAGHDGEHSPHYWDEETCSCVKEGGRGGRRQGWRSDA